MKRSYTDLMCIIQGHIRVILGQSAQAQAKLHGTEFADTYF